MKILFVVILALITRNTMAMMTADALSAEAVNLYLDRLGLNRDDIASAKDEELLTKLIQRHLMKIPFENLTMHASPRTEVEIELDAIINKVLNGSMGRNRGGYCYEINELFYHLLNNIGFDVTRHKASVWAGKEPGVIPFPSHQLSVVTIGGDAYLADIGFGLFNIFQSVRLPREIDQEITLVDSQNKTITFKRVLLDESFGPHQQGLEGFIYSRFSSRTKNFERISSFALTPYAAEDFREHNDFVQNHYRPFLDNILFTRFNARGEMITRVAPRSSFVDMEEILRFINDAGDDFVVDMSSELQ